MASALREIIAAFGVTFDGKELEKGENQIQQAIGTLKKFGAIAAEAFAVKEVGEFVFGLAEQAEQLKHQSEALGISAQALQQWQFAANLSGVSADELQVGLQKLQRSAVGAGGKGGELAATFKKLGVSVKNSNGSYKNADELLTDVAGAIGDMTDPTLQTATAMEVFGRGGARLLPFLKQGRAGVEGLKKEVAELGGGFTEDFIEKSEDMIQNSKRFDFALRGLKVAAIGPLLPIISEMATGVTKLIVTGGKLVDQSNAAKAALVALGIAGATALAPIALEMAPVIAGFLALEDVFTFFSGGKSVLGDALDSAFGEGTQKKIQAVAAQIKDMGLADIASLLHEAFAIFTDDKPLTAKFAELQAYIDGPFTAQMKKDFGVVGEGIATWLSLVNGVHGVLSEIVDLMKWIGEHTVNAVGKATFAANDAAANEDAQAEARKQAGQTSLYDDLRSLVAPSADTVRQRIAGAGSGPNENAAKGAPELSPSDVKALVAGAFAVMPSVATAPVNVPPTTITQENKTNITQNFYADTPDAVARSASSGAVSGVGKSLDKGVDLLAAQGAVKKQGG